MQAHAPFPAYVFDYPNILDYAISTYKKCIEYCNVIGVKNLVVHGISRPRGCELSYEQIHDLNIKLYSSLIDTLKGTSVTVCLENLFVHCGGNDYIEGICSDPYEAVDYIDTLNKMCGEEHFGLCLDTGHLNLIRGEFRQYVSILGNRIKCTHINDNYGTSQDLHVMPYFGRGDQRPMLEGLKSIGYDGPINFETLAWSNKPTQVSDALIEFMGITGKYFEKAIKGECEIWHK